MNLSSAQKTKQADVAARVLIVEDNQINQTFMSTLLRKYSIPSTAVNNGLEAVNFLRIQTVDLVLMDIQMPVMDGLTATQYIREQLGLSVPVVAVSSNPEFDSRPRCHKAGMNDFLSKPIQKKQLEAILERFLHIKESRPSVIDQHYLQEIIGGDNDLLIELITFFKNDFPAARHSLLEAIDLNNRDNFDYLAHRFRSSLNSLAMLDVASNLKHLERNPTLPAAEVRTNLLVLFDQITIGLESLEEMISQQPPK